MKRLINNVIARTRTEGLPAMAKLAVAALHDRVLPARNRVYWVPARRSSPREEELGVEIRHHFGGGLRDHASRAHSLASLPREEAAEAETRLAAGANFHVIFVDGSFAGRLYTVPGAARPFQHLVLTDRDAMVLDARIVPDFRGRGLYPILLARTVDALADAGFERLYIDTSARNARSLSTFKRLGFVFLVSYRKRGTWYRYDATPL